MSTIPKEIIYCGLDAQQCQQECKHKNDRTNCPFVVKRCQYETAVIRFFGLPNHVSEKYKIETDFGVLCNLLASNQLATDGREEENVTVEYWQKLYGEAHQLLFDANTQITALQSQCTEKDQSIEKLIIRIKDLIDKNFEKEKECEELKVLGNDCVKTINQQTKELQELKAENERLSGLLVSLSNGEAMNVVRESDGVYSVIFKHQSLTNK